MALFRAIESAAPASVRLFDDRLAQFFLPPRVRCLVLFHRLCPWWQLVPRYVDWRWPGAMSSGIARTRYIDDLLRSALASGVTQVVILGAGFDCRAYRIAGIERGIVFEVDHSATLAKKRKCLTTARPALPSYVTFVETDFNERQLDEVMAPSGFDPSKLTFFIWEGVTNYLSASAVDRTLRWVATSAPGSQIVFTYVDRLVLDQPRRFYGAEKVFRALERTGEPWTFALSPNDVPQYLAKRGLQLQRDLGANEYRALYFDSRRLVAKGYEFYRIALARVWGEGPSILGLESTLGSRGRPRHNDNAEPAS